MKWEPRDPICPSFCRFNRICTAERQLGINRLFVSEHYESRAEACFFFEGTEEKWREKFGLESTAGLTSKELAELVEERMALQEEAS